MRVKLVLQGMRFFGQITGYGWRDVWGRGREGERLEERIRADTAN
jgi:hypothetical protein